MAYRRKPQPSRACNHCDETYTPHDPRQRYCTARCRTDAATAVNRTRTATYVCPGCDGRFTRLANTGTGATGMCSSCCRRGERNPMYRGGLSFNKALGRWQIICRDHSVLLYYRGVMEAHLGRPLRTDEHVHHINGDSTDDRVENLTIVSPQEHIALHRADLIAGQRRRVEERQAA